MKDSIIHYITNYELCTTYEFLGIHENHLIIRQGVFLHAFAATKVTRFSASLSFDQKSLSFEENFGDLGKFYPFFVEFWVEFFGFWHFCLSFVRILLEFCQNFLEFCQNFP